MESDACEQDVCERVIPTESIQLMFHYQQPFVVLKEDKIVSHQPQSIISGLSNSFSDVSTFGSAGVVFVAFQPAGACMFFRFPLSEIENQSLDMKDIFNKEIREVEENLYHQNTFEKRAAIIDSFLLKKLTEIKSHDYLLMQEGVRLIKQSRGQTDTQALSARLFSTPKTLERKFSALIGKTPGQFIKLIRFQATIEDMLFHKGMNFTDYAYRNGYADQSHFIRDFKSISPDTFPPFFKTLCCIIQIHLLTNHGRYKRDVVSTVQATDFAQRFVPGMHAQSEF
jgi:AraC-like DNA-binding protein